MNNPPGADDLPVTNYGSLQDAKISPSKLSQFSNSNNLLLPRAQFTADQLASSPDSILQSDQILTPSSASGTTSNFYQHQQQPSETSRLLPQSSSIYVHPGSTGSRSSFSTMDNLLEEQPKQISFLRRQSQQSTSSHNNRQSWTTQIPPITTSSASSIPKRGQPNATIAHTENRLRAWLSSRGRRSQLYDVPLESQMEKESVGMRVWYDDYTTIDWAHDHIKDKLRMRALRSIGGVKGWILKNYNASQAWILIFLVGVTCGAIAAGIQISQDYLNDLKEGYCETNYFHRKRLCCPVQDQSVPCESWVTWADHVGIDPRGIDDAETYFFFNYAAYVFFGVLFALFAVLLVRYNRHSTYEPNNKHIDTDSTTGAQIPAISAIQQSRLRSTKIIYHAAGSGIPEVKTILGGFVIRGFLGFRTLVTKVIGLTFAVSSGLNLGAQGPLVHISACVGNVYSRFFQKYSRNEGKRREILSASCAAGVSVAFGAPIGGVLFSLEEVSYYFPLKTLWRTFFCALIAAITLKLLDPLGTGKLVLFQVTYDRDWHAFELLPFAIIGIFGGIYGAFFVKIYMNWVTFKNSQALIRQNPVMEVIIVTLITGMLNYLNPFTQVSNLELITGLFGECPTRPKDPWAVSALGNNMTNYAVITPTDGWEGVLGSLCSNQLDYKVIYLLGLCIGSKIFLNILTFGLKIPAGVFIPSMVVGACAGRILGMFTLILKESFPSHPIFSSCSDDVPCVTPGVYAMVGSAAALTGVTRSTISLIVIMFELTGNLTYVLPLMIAIMVSKWVADLLTGGDSLFQLLIEANGHPYLDPKKDPIHHKTLVEIMEPVTEFIDVRRRYSVRELEAMLAKLARGRWSDDGGFPILEDNGVLVGYIAYNELQHAINLVKSQFLDEKPCFFRRSHLSPTPDSSSSRYIYRRQSGSAGIGVSVTSASTSSNGMGPPQPPTMARVSMISESVLRGRMNNSAIPELQNETDWSNDYSSDMDDGNGMDDDWLVGDGAFGVIDDPNDFTPWTDVAPLTLYNNSSMEMVTEMFTKLGAKTIIIVSHDGRVVGIVHKKRFLAYLRGKL
ncbi:hypothetical protein HK098_006156 [Nowakowskiella sp. JEL0407]|nr:hypothetical protein HK098_006156 [Nowakowskiella sp. JEL0407]